MNRVPENPLGDSQDWDFTVLDESKAIPGSESREETPERKLASWRENMKYMEKLKKYRPKEYEEIMKEREAKGIKPPPELDNFGDALRASVLGANEGFSRSLTDLQGEVSAASERLCDVARRYARLELVEADESPSGMFFEMRMRGAELIIPGEHHMTPAMVERLKASGQYEVIVKDGHAGFQLNNCDIAAFFIPAHGYPIRAGCSVQLMKGGKFEREIAKFDDLRKYFVDMASNPKSTLVLRTALLFRNGIAK